MVRCGAASRRQAAQGGRRAGVVHHAINRRLGAAHYGQGGRIFKHLVFDTAVRCSKVQDAAGTDWMILKAANWMPKGGFAGR